MPNTYSKLAAAETTHGVLGDREHIIEELENHIFSLQGSLRDSKKKYNDLLSQLQRGGKFYNINYLLQNTIQRITTIIILAPFLLTV